MNYQFPLTAINREGDTRIVPDAKAFREFAFNRANGNVGAYWMEARGFFGASGGKLIRVYQESTIRERWYAHGVKNTWIVRDNRGRPVDSKDFEVARVWNHGYRWSQERQDAAERGLPIPGTGKRRRYSRGYRRFSCNLAMRAAEAAIHDDMAQWDVEGWNVGRRRSSVLPQVWDDVPYRWGRGRGWKEHRATQWR